jgi:hypothetical protein
MNSISVFSIIYLGLVGFLAGLTTNKIMHFRSYQNILKVIAINVLAMLVNYMVFSYYYGGIYSLLKYLIINSIFLALLMVTFAKTVNRDQPTFDNAVKPVSLPSEEVKSANVQFLSWWKRMLIGGAIGILIIIIVSLIFGGNAGPEEIILIVAIYAATGFIIYPCKVSIFLVVLGFFIAGIIGTLVDSSSEVFILFGTFLGIPGGALLSRILYWVKVIK